MLTETLYRCVVIPVVSVAIAFAVRLFILAPLVGVRGPVITFFLAVVASVLCGGLIPGLVATVLSTLTAVYFFIEPKGSFRLTTLTDAVLVGYFAMTCVVVSIMGELLHRSKAREFARTEEIATEQERLQLATSAADVGIWDYQPATGAFQCDNRARRHLAIPDGAAANYLDLFAGLHPDDRPRVDDAIQAVLAQQVDELYVEFRIVLGDAAEHWVEAKGRVVSRGPTGSTRLTGTTTDITAHKRSEEALKEADRRKNEFLATLAHELRNPLAPIRTGLQILKLTTSPEDQLQARGMMERQIAHMVRLIDDLLDISRITRGKIELKRERLDLKGILESAVEASVPFVETGRHSLIVEMTDEPLPVDADPTRLIQVFSNLLNNAAKFTPDLGKIRISARRDDQQVFVSVEDSGVGITRDMLAEIFEMFAQGARNPAKTQGGLGIGLTLVRKLTEMHGGTVSANSEGPNAGSTFVVRLPLCESNETAHTKSKYTSKIDNSGKIAGGFKVLVVDDNVDAAKSLTILLKHYGHKTCTVFSGSEGFKASVEFVPDLVFLDIGLPELDGYEVARKIRSRADLKQPVLVALTGWGSEEDRQQSKRAGFDHHLTKPVETSSVDRILAVVHAKLARTA